MSPVGVQTILCLQIPQSGRRIITAREEFRPVLGQTDGCDGSRVLCKCVQTQGHLKVPSTGSVVRTARDKLSSISG